MEIRDVAVDAGAGVIDDELSDEELEIVVGGLSRVLVAIDVAPVEPQPRTEGR